MTRSQIRTALVGVVLVVFAVGAFVAYSGGGYKGTPAQRLRSWASNSGVGQEIGTLVADNARIATIVSERRGTGAVHADCAVLLMDAESGNASLPSTDTKTTDLLDSAYNLEGEAANNCYAAGDTNHALLATSSRERSVAQSFLDQALARMKAVIGTTVATTTTTEPGSGGIF